MWRWWEESWVLSCLLLVLEFQSSGVSGKHHNRIRQTDGWARHVPSDVWSPAHSHKIYSSSKNKNNLIRWALIGWPTSCRESVIGSFSSVSSSSNTGLDDVDGGASSSVLSSLKKKIIYFNGKAFNRKIKKGCLQNNNHKLINNKRKNNPAKILQNKRPKTNTSSYNRAAMHF